MKKISIAAIAAVFIILSCSDETTVYSDPTEDTLMENSETVLENSVVFDNSGVLDIFEENSLTGKFSPTAKNGQAGDYPLTLVAQITPPSFNGGENLTASHVFVEGDYAYVSYNTVEDAYVGGIDIIDVRDPNRPRVRSRLYYVNADINSITYNDGYVYAVGGVDSEKSVRATSNSFVAKIRASYGYLDTSNIVYGFQEGFNANDVRVTSNSVLVTSGRDGFLTVYNKADMTVQNSAPFADLRSVALNGSSIAVLDASKGVDLLDANLQTVREITIDSDFGSASKRTLDFSSDRIVVSEGSNGAGIYDPNTGSLIEYVPILVNPEGVAESDIVTNAVALNQEVLLMANGGAGLSLSEDQGNNTDLVGIIELNGSINFVASKDDYIFAASGKEGLQVIKLNRPNESLVTRCASLPAYSGSSNLVVAQGETQEYRGAKRFNSITVDGSLLLCGSWTTNNSNFINENGLFEMNGVLSVGRNNKRKNITLGKNATLRVEGNLNIYGDLILEDGSTIEFLGGSSEANIFGSVKKSGNVTVKGQFLDVRNKF
ncbi:hypothetical protein ACEZ3G_10750 [Maribacter algicola]|uniref:Uncharacterized protein n=1 Tax=Meishania litoralis TaxID=3434685 RepID=A0ACC7LL31_9FLAO